MSQIKIEKPDKSELEKLGIKTWSPWDCEPSSFPWQYSDKETAYVFEGHVTVETEDGEKVEIQAGDLVTFPKGMKCKWTVHETIKKVYKFG